jgi:hypothetical protein
MADENEDPAARLARIEAELTEERQKREAAEGTLRTLEGERRQPAPSPRGSLTRLTREEAEAIANDLGWSVEQAHQHYPVIEYLFRHAARPVMNGLNGIVDLVDDLDARTDLPDWKDVKDDVTKVLKEHHGRGEFITRKKAAALVKAQKMQDPAFLDALADKRAKQREEEAASRDGERTAAMTEGTRNPTQIAGPSPTKGSSKAVDATAFKNMSLDEQRKYLDESGLQF